MKSIGGKKNRKYGRAARKPKTLRYKMSQQRERNKLKRILQSCGYVYAKEWAKRCSVLPILISLVK